jgi:hypothetical protein
MSKLPGRNSVAKTLAPGIWIDTDGNPHFSLPDILKAHGYEDNTENRMMLTHVLKEMFRAENPETKFLEREEAD